MSDNYTHTMTKHQHILLISLVALAVMIVSCSMETKDRKNQRAADKWRKPASTAPPTGKAFSSSKRLRTYVYWSDISNLIDSMYEISLSDDGRKPRTLYEVGGVVCGLVAEEINKLPTDSVDEDAVNAGQKVYATLLKAKAIYTEWGGTAEALANDPGALGQNDPGRSFGAGVSVMQKQVALERETQIELARSRALLESRYDGIKFKMPHEFDLSAIPPK